MIVCVPASTSAAEFRRFDEEREEEDEAEDPGRELFGCVVGVIEVFSETCSSRRRCDSLRRIIV